MNTWTKTIDGYKGTFDGNRAMVLKIHGKFVLRFRGVDHAMPKKASFDHAEGIIAKELGR